MELKAFILAFALFSSVKAQYGSCDYSGTISSAGASISLNHASSTTPCRYQILAPANTFIQASCTISLSDTSCNSRFLVSRSGNKNLIDYVNYCASGPVSVSSIGNELVVVIVGTATYRAGFTCKFNSVVLNNTNCDCGWVGIPKIVGGVNTNVNEYISHVGLQQTSTNEVYCGGVILKQDFVLTAAHCIYAYGNFVGSTRIIAGDWNTAVQTDTNWAAVYAVASFIVHPSYSELTGQNDVALVRTATYIRFNFGVGPACMPYTFNNVVWDTKSLTAVGWGMTSYGGEASSILKKVSLTCVNTGTCATQIKAKDVDKVVNTNNVCTYGDAVRDTCSMDSGGGLYWFANRNYIIGIVNYGIFCAAKFPSVNLRVDKYFSFIESNVGFLCRKT